jgi:5-methylthioadenosine/S-adenosylhomocysteine deaminase
LYGDYFNVISHLVYATKGSDVDTVIVDGKIVMENRIIKRVDENKVIEKAQENAIELLRRIST